jgi:SAM-dependent methyltransferase
MLTRRNAELRTPLKPGQKAWPSSLPPIGSIRAVPRFGIQHLAFGICFALTVCVALPTAGSILLGPYVRFVGPDSATVNWLTTTANSSIVEFGTTNSLGSRVEDPTAVTNHSLAITGLMPRTKYYFVIKELVGSQEISSELLDFESDYNFSVPPAPTLPSPYTNDSMTGVYASVAQGVLEGTGLVRGYCLDYGCGEGRLTYELARRSDLNIVGVAEDPAAVARARQALKAAGLYGSRVSIIQSPLWKLPHTKDVFNLIVSGDMLTATNCPGQASEMFRVLRPAGGVAWIGYPTGVSGSLSNWPALDTWIHNGIATTNASIQTDPGRSVKVTRNSLVGGGTWSHGYADPGNTACSQDQRILGAGMKLQWFGLPGPRGMIDRGCRNPQPLAVNGFLLVEGLNRLSAQDAYNGRIYWSMEVPRLIRVNIPRDSSNICADESSLYLAVRDKCWRLDSYSGQLTQYYALQAPNQSTNHDWGYVAVVTNRLYGSSVKRGASYTEYNGPAYWYDSLGTESTAKVCGDNLFCLSRTNGLPLWTYRNGVIINSSIAIGGGRVYFVESRNAVANSQTTGRITVTNLWADLYLVARDAGTGAYLWEQPLSVSTSPYPAVFFLCYTAERLLLTSSTSQFYLYAFNAQNGASLWQKSHAWTRNNHGGHMYHPVIVGNTIYLEPYAYDVSTGGVVRSGLPSRAGCSTMSAAGNMMHVVQMNYASAALCFWDLATDQRRQMVGSRASCWMSIISADGMVLSPTASTGCTCQFPLQTSIGFGAP